MYSDLMAVLTEHGMRHHEPEAVLVCEHFKHRTEGYASLSPDNAHVAAQWEIESLMLEAGILSKRRMPHPKGW